MNRFAMLATLVFCSLPMLGWMAAAAGRADVGFFFTAAWYVGVALQLRWFFNQFPPGGGEV